jgi:hypothetical protein
MLGHFKSASTSIPLSVSPSDEALEDASLENLTLCFNDELRIDFQILRMLDPESWNQTLAVMRD